MENLPKAYFVKHKTTNNIVVITNVTRKYFEKMAKVDPNYILLDEYEQVIGQIELNPKEAEVYVEQKLEELQAKHERLEQKEKELNEREALLKERESNSIKGNEPVKVDKRKKI
jgi:hypothetical protein